MRILLVEDEPKVARAVADGLAGEHYEVTVATTGDGGHQHLTTEDFDLAILDLNLPGRDGLEILTSARNRGILIPVLLLTARGSVEDRVRGLENGADDYLVKPFAFSELLARVKALLRRGRPEQLLKLHARDLELDLVSGEAIRGGQALDLTLREKELLEYLLRHQGQAVSREMLAQDVWKMSGRITPLDNVINVHVSRLRKKVDRDFPVKLIHTVRGVGFVLAEEAP